MNDAQMDAVAAKPVPHAGIRLSVLMFLQFFIWGAWSVTLGLVMQRLDLGDAIADAFSAGPLASIAGSFVIGMVAARYISPKLLLVLAHGVGGAILFLLPAQLEAGNAGVFLAMLFAYLLLYMPSIGLANAVALRLLGTRVDRFPVVRAFGTIGWIVAGLIIGWSGLSASSAIFTVAGAASLLLAIYALTLPSVARDAAGGKAGLRDILCLDAFSLMRRSSFLIFIVCSTLISIPLALYYAYASPYLGTAGFENVSGALALGQGSELIFMFAMPWLYRRFGAKPLLFAGMVAWALRYVLFAIGDGDSMIWAIYGGIILHGLCYDFFFVAGAIYTEEVAARRGVAAQAQGMLTMFTYGLGMLLGAQAGGIMYAGLSAQPLLSEWHGFWLIPAGFAAVVALIFMVAFRPQADAEHAKQ